MDSFYTRLSYSFGNEDWKTERAALQIQPGNRVICVTGSGDRPLHLLLDRPEEIVAIDANKVQNHLLNLKCIALQNLSYSEYLAFLGGKAHQDRKACFQSIMQDLDPDARSFWVNNQKMIVKGVLYQGALERCASLVVSPLVRLLKSGKVDPLFLFNDLEEQKAFVDKYWNTWLFRNLFRLIVIPAVRCSLRDPGFDAYEGCRRRPSDYVFDHFINGLECSLAKDNCFLWLYFKGRVPGEAFPPYLTEEGTQVIKKHTQALSVVTDDLVHYLESSPENSFDRFSLSDVASYLDADRYERLLHAVYRTARPGARFCIRQFISRREVPESLSSFFIRELELEERLEKEDRSCFYRFMVGRVTS